MMLFNARIASRSLWMGGLPSSGHPFTFRSAEAIISFRVNAKVDVPLVAILAPTDCTFDSAVFVYAALPHRQEPPAWLRLAI
jgi:hypothetical protein